MKTLFLAFLALILTSCNLNLSGDQLLDKAIAYHDPENQWSSFNGHLNVIMEIPDQSNRITDIKINLPEDFFYSKAVRDSITIEYEVNNDKCLVWFNGRTEFTIEEIETHRLDCDRAKMYRNYYTYLYGLPMKLKDPGTQIDPIVERKAFKGKEYLVLKATYDETVGSDIWYFYFDPKTYAMEIYQFFKKDENGLQNNESGEYILLTEEALINNIRMPKIRAWYYNKNDDFLGTDILN